MLKGKIITAGTRFKKNVDCIFTLCTHLSSPVNHGVHILRFLPAAMRETEFIMKCNDSPSQPGRFYFQMSPVNVSAGNVTLARL